MKTVKLTRRKISAVGCDESGQATIEWVLVVVALVLPIIYFLNIMLNVLVGHYRMVTFLETLPFP